MVHRRSLTIVPLSLLLLIADWPAQSESIEFTSLWSRKLPPSTIIHPRFEFLNRRESKLQKLFAGQKPIGARKMSGDESEMFLMEYWQFDNDLETGKNPATWDQGRTVLRHYNSDQGKEDGPGLQNASMPHPFQPPFSLHSEQQTRNSLVLGRLPRGLSGLDERAFQCPSGTSSCSSISRPNSCCPLGDVCQLITDTGKGDVGCCQEGQSCSDEVSNCQEGYPSCPGSQGGGCCIPGYTCVAVGCRLTCFALVIGSC